MGGTTAKAGVIHNGHVLMTGGALIGGYATGLPVQMPMIDIQEVGTGGGSIARAGLAGALRVGTGKRRRGAGSGLLRARRRGADHHRRQSRARPACRRSLSRRRDEARHRRRETSAQRQDRQAARADADRSRRGHPAHRDDEDVARGALGDDRARARCRGFRARRLWRRRPAARRHGGARIAHRQSRRSARAGAFLGLRHADGRPAPRLRPHLVHAARQGVVRGYGESFIRTWSGAAAPASAMPMSICRKSSSRGAPTCAMSARSTPSASNCRPNCSPPRIATASSAVSMPCTRRATAMRRRASRPRS